MLMLWFIQKGRCGIRAPVASFGHLSESAHIKNFMHNNAQ